MTFAPGARLGPYEIMAPLGKGGMGEVYRARDIKLGRDVAIKVLPMELARDPEGPARFEREAKVLAALNHPNIATIYGLEEFADGKAIAMELVEGATLRSPLALDEALKIAAQIADALEAAHDKSITHRDLKPANIMVTPAGLVKVLDFGLATARRTANGTGDDSATASIEITKPGIIMGTPAFMAPEQAAGSPIDRRADIWAFGAVLWQMLTGKPLFAGETTAHILANVIQAPIDFGKLPETTPSPIRELVKRCLDRDIRSRLQVIGEARIAIQKYLANPQSGADSPALPPRLPPSRIPWIAAAGLALTAAGLGYVAYRNGAEQPPRVVKTSIMPAEKTTITDNSVPALSPDGRRLAFAATEDGKSLLWIRELDAVRARGIAGTEGIRNPFWSPDSQSVAFFAGTKLKRIDIGGGPVLTLCDSLGGSTFGSWSSRGLILFSNSGSSGLFRVAAAGGTPVPVTTLDTVAGDVSHRLAWFLPDGRHFLFTIRNHDPVTKSGLYVGDLDANPDSKERHLLFKGEVHAVFVPGAHGADQGYLLYTSSGIEDVPLMALAMNASTLRTSGDPVPVVESVDLGARVWAIHQFSASRNGVLTYASTGNSRLTHLTWLDRSGKVLGAVGTASPIMTRPSISPDGRIVAVGMLQGEAFDLWLHDVTRGTSLRLSQNRPGIGGIVSTTWSPDGQYLIYGHGDTLRPPAIWRKAIGGGPGEGPLGLPWEGSQPGTTRGASDPDLSRDGRYGVATLAANSGATGTDIGILSLNPAVEKPRLYLQSDANESAPKIAPSSDWLAYGSDETHRLEVYVQSFPTPGRKYRVSVNGGASPIWSRDGKELYFIAPDRQMMAVAVKYNGRTLEIGAPKALFDSKLTAGPGPAFDVGKDGRFLIPVQDPKIAAPLTLVVNWQAAVKGHSE